MQNSFPIRLERALSKLYTAFNEQTLNPECCKQCAAGNIADHKDAWKHFSDSHGSLELNYVGKVNEIMGRKINGYLPSELLHIERIFLQSCGYQVPLHKNNSAIKTPKNTEMLYEGLSGVISYLCALDGVANVMDITRVFEEVLERSSVLEV